MESGRPIRREISAKDGSSKKVMEHSMQIRKYPDQIERRKSDLEIMGKDR